MSSPGSHRINTLPENDLVEDGASEAHASVSSSDSPFAPNKLLAGKYLIEREIAEGGLGIVMKAMHVELGQPVAIKCLKPEVLAKPVLVERFKREAQLAASIRSDHVVRILDVGVAEEGGPFMVMELLEGEDLGNLLGQGPLPVEMAVDYVIQACDALAEAHALGIVHRDLKPENLFVVRRKNTSAIVKILDFGISKTYERKTKMEGAPRVRQMTDAGDRFGTPLYMSPEQLVRSADVDSRADIWALGVVLYELVTGVLPFEGDTVSMYSANVVSMPPVPLHERMADAHVGLEAVIARCLEKKPDARYRNIGELVVELVTLVAPNSKTRTDRIKRFVLDGGESIRPPRPLSHPEITLQELPPLAVEAPRITSAHEPSSTPAKRPVRLAIAVGLLVLLAAGGAMYAVKRTSPESVTPPVVPSVIATAPPAPPPLPAVTAIPEPAATGTEVPSVAAAASSARPAPVVRPPPVKRNDYNEFGERH